MSVLKKAETSGTDAAAILADTVISNGYCVGCGACASFEESPFQMTFNEQGQYEPVRMGGEIDCKLCDESQKNGSRPGRVFATTTAPVQKVCPFSHESASEDEIGSDLFSADCKHNQILGYYQGTYVGHVTEADFRERGSSGGFGNWVLHELLNQNKVDCIINVQPRNDNGSQGNDNDEGELPLFAYTIVCAPEELKQGSKSRYYPHRTFGCHAPGAAPAWALCHHRITLFYQECQIVIAPGSRFCSAYSVLHRACMRPPEKYPLCPEPSLANGHSAVKVQEY